MERIEYGDMFPMDVMQQLMDGFTRLKEGKENSYAFLDVLEKDLKKFEIQNLRYLLACYPISTRNFLAACCATSDAAKLHSMSEYQFLQNESPNNLPFLFSICAHQGCFAGGDNRDYTVLLRELNQLCRLLLPHLEYMHPAARRRLRMLLDEVLSLDKTGNRFFFDFDSFPDMSLFEPLSQKRINQLTRIANKMVADRNQYFMVRSQREAFEVLRFHASGMNGHVKGFEKVSKEAAQALLSKSIWNTTMFKPSPYMIATTFEALCFHGDNPYKVLAFAMEYKDILLRPYRYPRFCRATEEAFCRFVSTPSRLAHGIATSIKSGSLEILQAFLTEQFLEARQLVDNKIFVNDLCCQLTDPVDLAAVARVYAENPGSKYAATFRLCAKKAVAEERNVYPKQKIDDSNWGHFYDEEQLIKYELTDWGRFYDDHSVMLKSVTYPDFEEWGPVLRMGYCNDPVITGEIVRRFPEAIQFIPEGIRAIINEREQEEENAE